MCQGWKAQNKTTQKRTHAAAQYGEASAGFGVPHS